MSWKWTLFDWNCSAFFCWILWDLRSLSLQWWHLWSLSVCSELTGACVSVSRPRSRWLLSLWPGRLEDAGHKLCEAGQSSPGSPAQCQPHQPHPVTEPGPGSETSWEPGAGAVSGLLSSSLSLHPRYKATLEPGPSHPPPPGSPGSPRIFTFKSPIHRFAFKCFFSETSRLSDYLPTAGHQLISNSFSLIWENILHFTRGSHNPDWSWALQYSPLRYARVRLNTNGGGWE